MGHGLQIILRMYGRTKVNDVVWVWDYANEKPMLEKEMTPEMTKASDIAYAKLLVESAKAGE
jgi:hypothetical protein